MVLAGKSLILMVIKPSTRSPNTADVGLSQIWNPQIHENPLFHHGVPPLNLHILWGSKNHRKSVTTFPGSARSVKLQIPSIPRNHTMWTCRGSQGRRDQGWCGWNWWLCESSPGGAFGSFCRADFEGTWVIQLQKMQRNQENGAKINSPYLVAGGVVITVYSLQWPW